LNETIYISMQNIEQAIEVVRDMSKHLIPFTYPQNNPHLEDDIAVLKTIDGIDVDGYTVVVYFNRADYEEYYLETLQVYGKYTPFLPFSVVVKLAWYVLGGHELRFTDFYQDGRKMYCWTVCLDKAGRPIENPDEPETQARIFEGFEYRYLSPEQINLY